MNKESVDTPKRVKVTLACITCRKKKVKCNGNKPVCARCDKKGLVCEFPDRPRKRGPPKNRTEVIENRAHRMETLLGTTDKQSSTYTIISANAFLKLVTGAVDALKYKWRAECLLTGGPMTSLANDTLTYRFKLQLADKYFTNFNLLLPILSRHHFLHRLVHNPEELDPILCCAVSAMGSRYLEQRDDMERLYFERFLVLFEKLKSNEPTIAHTQGVIIMCWYTFMMGDMKKCAGLRRHLVHCVRQLDLGVNADSSLSIVQTEERRRTFWVIHTTDAWFSFYTNTRLINMAKEGWNCKKPTLEDSQLQAIDSRALKWRTDERPQVLVKDETTEAALQIPSFDEMIRLTSIAGDTFDWLQHPSQPAYHLESQLDDWFHHLPSYLEYDEDDFAASAPMAKTIRILYHTLQIIMYQSPLILKADQITRDNICLHAADSIIHIAGQMLQQVDEQKLYNSFTMSITLATSVHLESRTTTTTTANNLGHSIHILKDANCSYLTRVEFDRLVDRYLTNRCGLTLDDEFKSSHQLADMRPTRSKQLLSPPPHQQPNMDIDTLLTDPISNMLLGGLWLSNPHLIKGGSTSSVDSIASSSSTFVAPSPPDHRQENCIRLLHPSTLQPVVRTSSDPLSHFSI